jgi:2-oxoglutarate ferredoxin oxidoreductase subunit alpha
MNEHLSEPLQWDDNRKYDRGKVLNAEELENMPDWGRYRDIDGDGIPYRTLPGTHPTRGAYFTRGSSHDENARYTEDRQAYVDNVDRLLLKWETAKKMSYAPVTYQKKLSSRFGLIFYGTTTYATLEAMDFIKKEGVNLDAIRITSFPFHDDIKKFIETHEVVFVLEQNRDAQMKKLLIQELEVNPKNMISVLNYDGTPITADFIYESITQSLSEIHNHSTAITA